MDTWSVVSAVSFGDGMDRSFQANHFLDQSQPPKISTLTLRRLIGPAGEPAIHIDMTIALRNKTEVRRSIDPSKLFHFLPFSCITE